MATSERELEPGTLVAGKLRVVRTLGVGGMGAVYEVEHSLTKHHRALKILHRRVSQSSSVVARFHREASAAARIGNPHIAETFDAGTLDTGEAYLLMELLEGETLDARLKRLGPLDPRDLGDLVRQACDGVQAAHEAGIVHRDLKPENLFVTTRDHRPFVKVLDFGISKFERENAGAMGITAEGAVMGTPFYMPPEQVRGLPSIDHRADIYSLGVILYECSCGVRPYEAQTIEQLAVMIHEGKAIPLAERRPELPHVFCDVVMRAMNVDRDARFASARALSDALASTARVSILPPGVHDSGHSRVVLGSLGEGLTELGGTIPAMVPPTQKVPDGSARAVSALAATVTPAQASVGSVAEAPTTATASPVSDTMPPPESKKKASRMGTPIAVVVAGAMIAVAVLTLRGPGPGATPTASPSPARSGAPVDAVPGPVAAPPVAAPPSASELAVDASRAQLPAPTRQPAGKTEISVNSVSPELSVSAAAAAHAPGIGKREGRAAASGASTSSVAAPAGAASSPPTRAQQSGLGQDNPYSK